MLISPQVNLYDELVGVVQALEATGVEYALVGGLAVSVWGAPRATSDIDLLVRPEDVAGATEAAHNCGYKPEAPTRFSDGMGMQRVSKIVSGRVMTLDFLLVDANLEPACLDTKIDMSAAAITARLREAAALLELCRKLERGPDHRA
ncbi:MAG TPA: hypothetical protein VJV78_20135 [Polyangiales bacterium]|nr:hypothetical protein [Polyangiales bacterium]